MGRTNAMNAMNAEYVQMTEALRWQQQRIIELETENRDLRRQLDDLRRGVGVSLVIEGRQIPLATSAAASAQRPSAGPSAGPTLDAPWTSDIHPVVAPAHTTTPAPLPQPAMPPQRAFTTNPPIRPTAHAPHTVPPQAARLPQYASATNGEGAFPENAWLTGSMPAVKPAPPSPQQQQPQNAQRYTPPTWLREEAPTVASWETERDANPPSSRNSRMPAQRQHLPHPHTPAEPIPAEIWRAEQRLDPGKFPTLAQMTGQHPAVRIPAKRKKAGNTHCDDRNPFTDSFVLG